MMCTFGMAPSNLVVLPPAPTNKMTFTDQMPDMWAGVITFVTSGEFTVMVP